MPHPLLVSAPLRCPSHPSLVLSLATPSHVWPISWHLSMIFLHLSTAVRHLCARYPPHPVTCRCAVHLWPRYSASTSEYCIDKTGAESVQLYSCRGRGPFVVVYDPVQGSGPEPRTNSCSHTRAYAGPGARSQHDRNEKPPDHINCGQTVLAIDFKQLGGHEEQWRLLAVAVVKRKL